jgi:aldose 1-epimerase
VEISWDESCRWVQVYTLDLPGSPLRRRAVAVEPMTCPADAFNSGTGLVHLGPGQQHSVSWEIRGLDPEQSPPA